jgi:2TM family of unknown function (DUF5676)
MHRITSKIAGGSGHPGSRSAAAHASLIPVAALGMSLGLFFVIAYVACVVLYLLFPDWLLRHVVLSLLMPGFKLLDFPVFILGLLVSFGYGWVIALIFAPLYNFFAARFD